MNYVVLIFSLVMSFNAYSAERYLFTPLEKEMDEIANKYGSDSSAVLEQMTSLINRSTNATAAELALLHTYDCAVRSNLTTKLAKESLESLQTLSIEHRNNYSVLAATALCATNVYHSEKNYIAENAAINKAFLLVKNASLATLRYWISLNLNFKYQELKDYRTAAEAVEIGVKVAKDNKDSFRQVSSLLVLAELRYKEGKYARSIKAAEETEKAFKNNFDQWYLQKLYEIKGLAYIELKQYDSADLYLNKSKEIAQKSQSYRQVQFLQLDIAHVALLMNDLEKTKKLIESVKQYAVDYSDDLLLNQVKLTESFFFLRSSKQNMLAKSDKIFSDAIDYFTVNKYQEIIVNAWKRRVEIARLSKQYELSNTALITLNILTKEDLLDKQQQANQFFYQANQQILEDTNNLANKKYFQLSKEHAKLAEQKNMLLIIIIILLMILSIAVVKKLRNWYHKRKDALEELDKQRFYDPLTGSYNRRYFDEHIVPQMLSNSIDNTGTLLTLDIDHFKKFNDTFGHLIGDKVLKEVVERLHQSSRITDKVVRTGGEEFVVFLSPQGRIKPEAAVLRILKLINETPIIIENKAETITVSIGYTSLSKLINEQSVTGMLNLADKALYLAKNRGRNRAIGIESLECSYDVIDDLEVAEKNGLLKLTEISGE